MARTVGIGIQSFEEIIKNDYFYIDKTAMIKEWWENGDAVTLITRPRRFGKTLNMSMIEQFFSVKYAGRGDLFEGLSIWKEEKYRKLQGTYPVIFLSFADIKESDFMQTRKKICRIVQCIYKSFDFLLESDFLCEEEKQSFRRTAVNSANMEDHEASFSIKALSEYLYRYYGKKVLIVLDEYDTPMQEAYVNGYWDEFVPFSRSLFNHTFKTNPYLERAVMAGVTRVSKESIFSDLNNLTVITTTSNMYETVFGFTEDEVFYALEQFGMQDKMADVKQWYDGFRFGTHENIYNPWSIINFLKFKELKTFWANTSSNQLIDKLMRKNGIGTMYIMEDLLNGGSFYAQIDEEIIFSQLDDDIDAVWSLLLAGGYLKVSGFRKNKRYQKDYIFSLTNMEIRSVFDKMVKSWFSLKEYKYHDFSDALLSGNIEFMNEYLNAVANETFSYFDTGSNVLAFKKSENFYHGFILGLIADLRELYYITSNRESGKGRYDVMMEPRNPDTDDGIILEFKVLESETERALCDTVQSALSQIISKNYILNLEIKGISKDRIRIYGFAFQGKKVLINGGPIQELLMESGE